MNSFVSIIFAVLIFGVLVFVHELGHFLAAKASGVQVNEFAIFMGPAIWKKQIGETLYAIRCIPFGGYCAMEGEDSDTDNPRSFQKAAWWKRLIILVAGAFMNLVLGFLIYLFLFMPAKQIAMPIITEFTDCCIFCTEDGLQLGDQILELDGEKIYVNGDISTILSLNPKVEHDVVVLRDGQKLVFEDLKMAHTELDENGNEYLHYGFGFGKAVDVDFADKLGFVGKVIINDIRMVRLSLQMLFTGQAALTDMTGPVGIVGMMSDVATDADTFWIALQSLLSFGAYIAVNLAVMNLLPIPALDGGRVVTLLVSTGIEKVTGKKLDSKYEGYVHGAFMILLLLLMALILFKDIFVIIKG